MEIKKIIWPVVALIIVAAVLMTIYPLISSRTAQTISTSGQYEIKAEPDTATLVIEFDNLAPTAKQAQDTNARSMEDIRNALIREDLTEDNFKTMNYFVGPEYEWTSDGQKLTGYRARHTLEITTDDIAHIGIYIDAAIGAGANNIQEVRFSLSTEKENQLKAQAISNATQDAKNKADAMAAGLGTKVKKVVSISDQSFYYQPYRYALSEEVRAGTAKAVDTQISPGQVDITAQVQAVFELA
jgi:hypothetical protein